MNPSRSGRSRLNHRHHHRRRLEEEEVEKVEEEEEVSLRTSSACAADGLHGSGGEPAPPLAAAAGGERARQSRARLPSDFHRAALGEEQAEETAAREARLERAVVRELRGAKSALLVSEVDVARLRARCERLDDDLSESVRTGLAARLEADGRAVHCRQLQREVRQLRESLGALREVVSAAKIQTSECRRDLHAVLLQLLLLRVRGQEMKQEIKSQLQKASQEFLLKEAERQGEMEQRYKSALAELQAAFLWTRQQLQRERQAHSRDLAALELLRRHLLNL